MVHNTLGIDGSGVNIAILDGGANLDHLDIVGNIVGQRSFLNGVEGTSGASVGCHHGPNVTGIVVAKGNRVGPGVAPGAGVVSVTVLDSSCSGFVSDWIAGIDWVVSHNATLNVKVLNMSLATDAQFGGANCDAAESTFAAAVNAAVGAGITVFASSGNSGNISQGPAPACLSGAIAVGGNLRCEHR